MARFNHINGEYIDADLVTFLYPNLDADERELPECNVYFSDPAGRGLFIGLPSALALRHARTQSLREHTVRSLSHQEQGSPQGSWHALSPVQPR